MAEIGDKDKLRRISDTLLARSGKMLPANVNDEYWQPVLSYGLVADPQRFYFLEDTVAINGINEGSFNFGTSDAANNTHVLPGGFLYELIAGAIDVDMGAAIPADDQFIRWRVTQQFFNVTGIGVGPVEVPILVQGADHMAQLTQLRIAQQEYFFTYPFLNHSSILPSGLNQIPHVAMPKILIPIPEGVNAPGRCLFRNRFQYLSTAKAPINYGAGATLHGWFLFKREPLVDYTFEGIV